MANIKCTCKDWKPNMKKINGLILSAWNISHEIDFKGYTGKEFKYCPWCGKELKKT